MAAWLIQQRWQILQRRWRWQRGEIDLIALHPQAQRLAFVEVKTRRQHNWDLGGLLAVDHRKQAKIGQAAVYFLSQHPHYADFVCRFDVASVICRISPQPLLSPMAIAPEYPPITLGKPIQRQDHQLCLAAYVEDAFGVG